MVLIQLEEVRHDETTPYGGHAEVTPALAYGARVGTRFTRATGQGDSSGLTERLASAGYIHHAAEVTADGPGAVAHLLEDLAAQEAGLPIFVDLTLRLPALPSAQVLTHLFLEDHKLWGKGPQWNDLLILASVIATPGTLLWTGDKRLANTASRFNVSYDPQ